jgi:uncharacterized protein YutE (UPF0331/DUF86 family)
MEAIEKGETPLLDAVLARYRAQGFEVFVHPTATILPEFVLPYRLDAIAIKPDKKIAIEVTRSSHPAERIKRLSQIFSQHPDWVLEVYYTDDLRENEISSPTSQAIQNSIQEIEELRTSGLSRAALVMGWSILEAIGRSLLPDQLSRPQPPRRLIETLASNGLLTPTEADTLRAAGAARNAVAHGQLDGIVEPRHLDQLIDALRTLLTLSRKDSSE